MRSNTLRVFSSGSRVRAQVTNGACTSCGGVAVPMRLMCGTVMPRRTTSTAFRPPKAKALDIATSTGGARATFGTQSTSHSGSAPVKPAVGGMTPSRRAMAVAISSSAPPAVMQWPIMDLVEDTGMRSSAGPNTWRSAATSVLSFSRVPVPWALT